MVVAAMAVAEVHTLKPVPMPVSANIILQLAEVMTVNTHHAVLPRAMVAMVAMVMMVVMVAMVAMVVVAMRRMRKKIMILLV